MLPLAHKSFVDRALPLLQKDPRVVGIAAAGSWITATIDEWSDLDFIVVCDPAGYPQVMAEREAFAGRLGKLLAAFTGEHVGEPRLLICLYDEPLLHVDLKFIMPDDLAHRIENPVVIWEKDGALSRVVARDQPKPVTPDAQWIEDRFWVWIHYGVTKLGRGELFEVIDMLGFLRFTVLGPLLAQKNGALVRGTRRLETIAPSEMEPLRRTVAKHDRTSCTEALTAAASLYRRLREAHPPAIRRDAAEAAAMKYLAEVGS